MDETSQSAELKMRLRALRNRKKAAEKVQQAESLPSIVGMSFLELNGLRLFVSPKENIAYLEK